MFPIRKTLKAFLQAKQNIELNRQLAQIKRQDWGEVACVFQPGKSGSTSVSVNLAFTILLKTQPRNS